MFVPRHSTHYHGNPARGGGVNPALHHTICRIALVLALIGWMSAIALPVYSQAGPESSSQRGLTLEERISYQQAVEEAYWRHRIWPKENPQPKPDLDEVMPLSAIRAKVEDYLAKSRALEAYWQRPITGAQLQAEMERMARQTKQPGMLKELWTALGNDPYVIAECLVRPSLANRLIRNWYAHDERYRGDLKRRAEADLRAYGTASQMRQMSGEYREVEWLRVQSQAKGLTVDSAKNPAIMLSQDEWATKVRELTQLFARGKEMTASTVAAISDRRPVVGTRPLQAADLDSLPVGELSRLQDEDERFYVMAVLEKGDAQLKIAVVEWKKELFDAWWNGGEPPTRFPLARPAFPFGGEGPGSERAASQGQIEQPSYVYHLETIISGRGTCVDDTWQPTLPPYVSARSGHTAVWTGSEMIVWGGTIGIPTSFNTGGRYDPATDTWMATATTDAPSARGEHTAVWTGSEMIVWGGWNGSSSFNTGGRYDPATDTWTATATTNARSTLTPAGATIR